MDRYVEVLRQANMCGWYHERGKFDGCEGGTTCLLVPKPKSLTVYAFLSAMGRASRFARARIVTIGSIPTEEEGHSMGSGDGLRLQFKSQMLYS